MPRSVDEVAKDLIERLTRSFSGDERRRAERHVIMAPAMATLLDSESKPLSEPLPVYVRDISETGVCVLFPEEIRARFVILEFGQECGDAAIVFSPIRSKSVPPLEFPKCIQVAGPFVKSGLER